jgi:hypothetical protein
MRQEGITVPRRVVLTLAAFRDQVLDPGTDRHRELSRLLSRLEQG